MPRAVYAPGAAERVWDGVPQHRACEHAQRDAFSKVTRDWLNFSSLAHTTLRAAAAIPPVDDRVAQSISRFVWPASGGESECNEVIEPLTGMARHPYASGTGCWLRHAPEAVRLVKMKQVTKYDIGHIIFASRCAATRGECSALGGRRFGAVPSQRPPRNLLFDLGCAKYGSPMNEKKIRLMGGGIQPSLPLLEAIYRRGCINFDGIWAWEASPMNPAAWWKRVPNATRKILTFHNRPVSADDFVSTLQREARPEDFVALKLDIDAPKLEDEIVRLLIERAELSELVDEMLFEFHVNLRHLADNKTTTINNDGTKCLSKKGETCVNHGMSSVTVAEAISTMQRLRSKGIRAHFWV